MVWLWVALPAVVPAQEGGETGYRLRLRIDTTSDWTRIDLKGCGFEIVSRDLTVNGDVPVAQEDLGVQKRPFDETPVSLRVECLLFDLDESIRIVVTKGDVGTTRVRLLGRTEKPLLDRTQERNVPNDPTNRAEFQVDAGAIRKGTERAVLPPRTYAPRVLAFYYPWYGRPDGPAKRWVHWNPRTERHDSTHTPRLGWYDSNDERTIEQHIRWAKEAGIDGFIISWWGKGTYEDRTVMKILDRCRALDFLGTLYYESCRDADQLRKDLEYVLDRYGRHEAFLKVRGRPVIFIYSRVTARFRPGEFGAVFQALRETGRDGFYVADSLDEKFLQSFDGLHTYNPATDQVERVEAEYRRAGSACRRRKRLFCATVLPGYDDTVIRRPGLKIARKDGRLYERYWKAARRSRADWVLITSFNEWHEGSEIEPGRELGDTYIRLTEKFSRGWRK